MAVIRPVPTLNIPRLISQGIQTFGAVQGLQQRQRQVERQEQVQSLLEGIETDPEALRKLAALDPEKFLQVQQARKFEQDRLQAERDRFEKERPQIAARIVGQPQAQQVRVLTGQIERVRQRGGNPENTQGLLDLIQGTPEQFEQAQGFIQNAIVEGERLGILKPRAVQKPEARTALARNLELLPGLSAKDRDQIVRANLLGRSQSFTVSPDGTVTFRSGKGVTAAGLQRPTARLLEKKLVSFEENIDDLKRIETQIKPEFLTFQGRGRAFFTAIKSKAGVDITPQEKQFVQQRKRFVQNINQFFNAYRKEITGAAASVQELEGLKASMFNEDLSPVEFEAAFDEFKNSVFRGRRLARKLLREGVSGNFKNKRSPAAKQFDQEFTVGGDDSALDRIRELEETKSEEEIFQILRDEGYTQ